LAITDRVALEWGRIAATAIVRDLIIVTRNSSDFCDTRAAVMNPWD
jgi:predicted nucleic acid-binding protein